MPAYVVVQVNVEDPVAYERYKQLARWWASPEYAEAKALRQRSAKTEMIVVEGLTRG